MERIVGEHVPNFVTDLLSTFFISHTGDNESHVISALIIYFLYHFLTQRGNKVGDYQFLHGPIIEAHSNMAANIDQIFQEFILNKIREIEVQNEDKT